VRLILDGTVIKTRLDMKATNISVLAAIGGESTAAWRQFINDLDARGLKRPEFVIVDGAPGLEAALIALWGEDLPIQRCTVHKHRNLLAHAPKRMHDELTEGLVPRLCCEKALDQTPIETAVVAIKNNERIIFLLANFSKVLSAPCSRHGFIVKPDPDQSKIRLRHANATFPKYLIRDYRRSFAWPIAKKIALGAGPGPKPKCWHKKPKVMAPRIASGLLRPVRFYEF
jgi:hypothetical protein